MKNKTDFLGLFRGIDTMTTDPVAWLLVICATIVIGAFIKFLRAKGE